MLRLYQSMIMYVLFLVMPNAYASDSSHKAKVAVGAGVVGAGLTCVGKYCYDKYATEKQKKKELEEIKRKQEDIKNAKNGIQAWLNKAKKKLTDLYERADTLSSYDMLSYGEEKARYLSYRFANDPFPSDSEIYEYINANRVSIESELREKFNEAYRIRTTFIPNVKKQIKYVESLEGEARIVFGLKQYGKESIDIDLKTDLPS